MDGDAGYERWALKGVWRSRICPRRVVTDESARFLSVYQHYRAGFLLEAGGVLDQSARYLEAMRVIEQAVAGDG